MPPRSRSRSRRHASAYRVWGGTGLVVTAGVLAVLRWRPGLGWLAAWLLGTNAASFLLYGADKLAARRRSLRVPEAVLHAFALAGGTPAAWTASRLFRHKTVKGRFRLVFRAIAVLQLALLGWLAWRGLHPEG